jgi:hypothetical protein
LDVVPSSWRAKDHTPVPFIPDISTSDDEYHDPRIMGKDPFSFATKEQNILFMGW